MRVRDRGFALIIVLLAVAAVFALAMQSAVVARSTTLEVGVVRDRVASEVGARGAVVLALKGLLAATPEAVEAARAEADAARSSRLRAPRDDKPQDDKPKRELPPIIQALLGDKARDIDQGVKDLGRSSFGGDADGQALAGRLPGGGYRVLQTLGLPARPINIDLDGRRYHVSLTDAQAALAINAADDDQLFRYFRALDLAESDARALTDQILDWRDADSVPRTRGAERDTYTPRGIVCRNANFATIEELLYLPAMSRSLFDRIRWDFRVGEPAAIHAGSASPAVLSSLPGVDRDLAEAIVRERTSPAFSRAALESLYPIVRREELKRTLRFEPSGLLRIRVEVSDIPMPGAQSRPASGGPRFEGLAIIDDRGIREIGLRAAN